MRPPDSWSRMARSSARRSGWANGASEMSVEIRIRFVIGRRRTGDGHEVRQVAVLDEVVLAEPHRDRARAGRAARSARSSGRRRPAACSRCPGGSGSRGRRRSGQEESRPDPNEGPGRPSGRAVADRSAAWCRGRRCVGDRPLGIRLRSVHAQPPQELGPQLQRAHRFRVRRERSIDDLVPLGHDPTGATPKLVPSGVEIADWEILDCLNPRTVILQRRHLEGDLRRVGIRRGGEQRLESLDRHESGPPVARGSAQ